MINKVLFFLFILLLPTQLGKHFFLPFSYLSGVRVDYLAPTIYLTDVIVFLLALINFKIVFRYFNNKKILIGLLITAINILFSQLPSISFYWLLKVIEFVIIFSLAKKMLIILKEKFILIALLFSTLFEFLLAIFQLINKHSVQGIFYFFGERLLSLTTPGVAKASLRGVELLRPYGTFSHPNSMAGFFLLLYFYVLTNKKFSRFILMKYLFLFISSTLIFISFSKIAIATYLILNTLYFILNTKLTCQICKLARLIVMFVVSSIFLVATTDPLTINKRIELMKNSLSIIFNHPFVGVGLGSYLVEQANYSSKFYLFFNQPVHNILLLFFSEFGLLLGGGLVFILLSPIHKLIKLSPYLIMAIALTGFFDHYWLTLQQNFLLMGLVMGLILSRTSPAR